MSCNVYMKSKGELLNAKGEKLNYPVRRIRRVLKLEGSFAIIY